MSKSEPKTSPDYYEKPLSEQGREARKTLEDRLAALDAELDEAKGIARLRLQNKRDRLQLALDWQGANPKELDLGELREVIHAPMHADQVEDAYRAKIKNQRTAIRAYCMVCMGGSVVGVKECPSITCPLFPFRMGKDPLRGFDLPKVEEPVLDDATEEDADEIETDEDEDDDDGED